MADNDRQRDHFRPEYQAPRGEAMEDIASLKKRDEDWGGYYLHYFLSRPMLFLIVIGLVLEVQPYEPIQPTYFIASRIVNREEIVLEGTEDEEAHKQGVAGEILAQIEQSKECTKQREINANNAHGQCVQAGKASGYCRHLYEQLKAVHCPAMPEL